MMKQIVFIAACSIGLFLAACNGTGNTGGATADSGSHGSSGATDTAAKGITGTSAESTGGSDTSKNGKGTDSPVTDTSKHNKPPQ
jgi:hypothetical protein